MSDKMAPCAPTPLKQELLTVFFSFFNNAFVNSVDFGDRKKSSFSGVMFFL